jgi:uncharacterized protein
MLREMQSPEGGYYSSLDADSEHEEGKFYVWERDEVRKILGEAAYASFAPRFGLDQPANFEQRHWHLHVAKPGDDSMDGARARLFAERGKRMRPGRDEKILVSWNALAIRGMARAGRAFQNDGWVASARRALEFIRSRMWRGGRLLAAYKDGRAHLNAYLDDYALLIAAQLELLQSEFSVEGLEFALALAGVLLDQFEDPDPGGFFFTAREHERLIHRPKPGHDHAIPSGNAVAAWALNRLAALTGQERFARAAERTLALFYPAMRDHPGGFAMMAIALDEHLGQPKTLVLRGKREALRAWQAALAREFLPDTAVLAVPEGITGLPALLDKPSRPAVSAWLCRGVSCLQPIDELERLKSELRPQN